MPRHVYTFERFFHIVVTNHFLVCFSFWLFNIVVHYPTYVKKWKEVQMLLFQTSREIIFCFQHFIQVCFYFLGKKTGGGTPPPGPSPCYGTVMGESSFKIFLNEHESVNQGGATVWNVQKESLKTRFPPLSTDMLSSFSTRALSGYLVWKFLRTELAFPFWRWLSFQVCLLCPWWEWQTFWADYNF